MKNFSPSQAIFFNLAFLIFIINGVTGFHAKSAWSTEATDQRFLVLVDSSKSMGMNGIEKIRAILSQPSSRDEVARSVTLVQYPTANGSSVLNFNNSAEFFNYLSGFTLQSGKTDLNSIVKIGQSWSREYSGYERSVVWISDGGGLAQLGVSDQAVIQNLETIAPLKNWKIFDLDEVAKLNFLREFTSQYSHFQGSERGESLDFRITSSDPKFANTNASSNFNIFLGDRTNILFILIITFFLSILLVFLFRKFTEGIKVARQVEKREKSLVKFVKSEVRKSEDSTYVAWNRLPKVIRKQIDSMGEKFPLNQKTRFSILIASTLTVIFFIFAISRNLLIALILGALLSQFFLKYLNRQLEAKDSKNFSKEFPGFLSLLSSGLKSGLSLEQGIDAYCSQNVGIVASEFRRVLSESRLGSSFDDSLSELVKRRNDDDLTWLVTAILIQKDVGGSLSSIMDTVLETIQSRSEVRREIRSLSAEGKLSAYVLIALPIFIFSFLFLTRRNYVEVLWKESLGLVILSFIGTLITIGWIWMKKVVNIKV